MHLFSIPLIYWNTADVVLHVYRHWNCLSERASCNFGNNKNSQGARYFEYLVYGSSKTSCRRALHTIFMILVAFWQYLRKFKYYFNVDNSTKDFNLRVIKYFVTFPSSLKNIAYISFFGVRNLIAVEGLFMLFYVPKFDLLLFYPFESSASATYNLSQDNWVVFGWFFFWINFQKMVTFEVVLFSILPL